MDASITNILRITVCTLFLAVFTGCSDDQVAEQNNQAEVSKYEPASVNSPLDQLQTDENKGGFETSNLVQGSVEQDEPIDDETVFSDQEDEYSIDEDEQYDEPSATLAFSAEETQDLIRWEAPEGVNYANAQITISTSDGDVTTRSFKAGEPIELYGSLPDGIYGWESVVTPEVNDYVREEMRQVRASGDLQAEKELKARLRAEGSLPTKKQARENRQSGSFIVQGGIVRPSLVDVSISDKDNGG